MPEEVEVIDPRFTRYSRHYLVQSALAAAATLAVLVFVDSLSNAALAAGLGSSILILFVHPTSHAALPRSLVGGHTLALVIGSLFALVLFAAPVQAFLNDLRVVFDLGVALSLGVVILVMAITDTEHPPAAGTVLGLATRPWDWERTAIIIAAVLLLALIKLSLNRRLRDLI